MADTTTADAVNWLESQGITMISASDGGLITSAVESGQTITLTGTVLTYRLDADYCSQQYNADIYTPKLLTD